MARSLNPGPMSVVDFVSWEDGTQTRYELVRGAPVAMAPPSGPHGAITGNVSGALSRQLRRPCQVVIGSGVARRDTDDEFRIPDLFVSCEATPETYYRHPRLVIEILSPSTAGLDRSEKLDFYRSLPTVETVVFVWQDRRRVQLVRRTESAWAMTDLVGGGIADIPCLGVTLALDEIYAGQNIPDDDPPMPDATDRRSSG